MEEVGQLVGNWLSKNAEKEIFVQKITWWEGKKRLKSKF